jgi:hypothetical protein
MRHVGSLLLALFVAPLVLVLTGRGIDSFRDAAASQPPDPLAGAAALASLMLAGILVALLIMPRLSPLGLLLSGLGYLAFGAWAMVDPDLFVVSAPWTFLGWDRSTVAATGAVALLLAMPMILSIFSIQRWRHPRNRWPASHPPAAYPPGSYGAPPYPAGYSAPAYPPGGYGAPAYGDPGGYGAPAYGAPAYGAPAYGPAGHAPGYSAASMSRPDPTLEMPAVSGDDPPTETIVTGPAAPSGPAPAGSTAPEEPTVVAIPDKPNKPTFVAEPPAPDTVDQGVVHADSPKISANKS